MFVYLNSFNYLNNFFIKHYIIKDEAKQMVDKYFEQHDTDGDKYVMHININVFCYAYKYKCICYAYKHKCILLCLFTKSPYLSIVH